MLPKVAAEVSAPLSQVDKITMVSDGDGPIGASKVGCFDEMMRHIFCCYSPFLNLIAFIYTWLVAGHGRSAGYHELSTGHGSKHDGG